MILFNKWIIQIMWTHTIFLSSFFINKKHGRHFVLIVRAKSYFLSASNISLNINYWKSLTTTLLSFYKIRTAGGRGVASIIHIWSQRTWRYFWKRYTWQDYAKVIFSIWKNAYHLVLLACNFWQVDEKIRDNVPIGPAPRGAENWYPWYPE